jgi:hypothetical protein
VCDQRQRPLFSCAHDSRPKVESSKVLTAKREASADPIRCWHIPLTAVPPRRSIGANQPTGFRISIADNRIHRPPTIRLRSLDIQPL